MSDAPKCPVAHNDLAPGEYSVAGKGTRNRDWWPNQLKLNILRRPPVLRVGHKFRDIFLEGIVVEALERFGIVEVLA